MEEPAETCPEIEISGEPTALYRFYDSEGDLLYVGITNNPTQRFGQHAVSKGWWPLVTRKTAMLYGSREEALAAEAEAIVTERPVHNIVGRARGVDDFAVLERKIEKASTALFSLTYTFGEFHLHFINGYCGAHGCSQGEAVMKLLFAGVIRDYEERFADPGEALTALKAAMDAISPPKPRTPSDDPRARRRRAQQALATARMSDAASRPARR